MQLSGLNHTYQIAFRVLMLMELHQTIFLLEQKFTFEIGTLNPHGINKYFSFN